MATKRDLNPTERESPEGPAVEASKAIQLLDALLRPVEASAKVHEGLCRFLQEHGFLSALEKWIDQQRAPRVAPGAAELSWLLERALASLDDLVGEQLDRVLHHPDFQRLEASWRGLQDLVGRVSAGANVKIKLFSTNWDELTRDLERALEFDQSALFRRVYSDEFDMPGGEPFSVLVGDYEVHSGPDHGHRTDDLRALASLAQVAAAAFAPLVIGAHPSLFGVDRFSELDRPMDLEHIFDQGRSVEWRQLREMEDARFLVLTVPRVLRREAYREHNPARCEFPYREDVSGPNADRYLWGPAGYAYAAVLVQAFQRHGWLEDIRGAQRHREGGGLIAGLPTPSFAGDPAEIAPRGSTDLQVDEELDRELRDLGFLPLCHCPGTRSSVFYGTETLHRPALYDRPIANANARLSAQIPVVLNASRFAHYLKVIARDKIGSFLEPRDLEIVLQRWLARYVSANEDAGNEIVPRYPLREGYVQVRERPERPGSLACIIHLRPRFLDEAMSATLRLMTELPEQTVTRLSG